MAKTIVIPTNPVDQKAIADAIKEASDSLTHIESERDQIKAIIDMVKEKYELPKGTISKMIKAYHNSSFDKDQTTFEDFSELYQTIIK